QRIGHLHRYFFFISFNFYIRQIDIWKIGYIRRFVFWEIWNIWLIRNIWAGTFWSIGYIGPVRYIWHMRIIITILIVLGIVGCILNFIVVIVKKVFICIVIRIIVFSEHHTTTCH